MGNDLKPGWKTSEFWLSAIATGMTLIQQHQGQIPQPYGTMAVAAITAIYTVARAYNKGAAQ